jgi:hypothetical protein
MADIDVSAMYKAVRDTVVDIVGAGVTVKGGYQNVAQPEARDELGNVAATYLVIVDIPTSDNTGRADVSAWTEDAVGSVGGSIKYRDDFEATYEIHQVGGRGELLQKIKSSMELDSIVEAMRTRGIACRRHGQTVPVYNEVNEKWGPDCMAEFIFAGSYRLTESVNKITDVKYTLDVE